MVSEKQFISELADDSAIETTFLVAAKSVRETRTGNPYLCLTLQDRTGTIEARGWDNADVLEKRFEVDDFVAVRGRVSSYKGELQITVSDLERLEEDRVDLGDYLPHSRWAAQPMFAALQELISEEVKSEEVRRFLDALFADERRRRDFTRAPAAVSNHHAYLAGLLEHTLSMARIAAGLARHYDAYYPGFLDGDLLLAGCVLHDFGKIDELSYGRSFDYSTPGRLVGHIVGGAQLVERIANELTPALDANLVMQLQHLVLSHHGKREYGAPVVPLTPEALLLHQIDMIDSRINNAWNACKELVDGDDSDRSWSDYQRNFGGFLYVDREDARGWKARTGQPLRDHGPGVSLINGTSAAPAAQEAGETRQGPAPKQTISDTNLPLFDD